MPIVRVTLALVTLWAAIPVAPASCRKAPKACLDQGEALLKGDDAHFDLAGAARRFRGACDAGYLRACVSLGLQMQDGRGVPFDPAGARALYRKACDGGVAIGCYDLGLMYDGGVHVRPDPPRAKRYFARARVAYRKACDAGRLAWCVNLGVLYEQAQGVPRDDERAAAIYRKACDKGELGACANLALLEQDGRGVPKDERAALALLRKACNGGSTLACGLLGQTLTRERRREGKPVPAEALTLLEKGCLDGSGAACGVLGAVHGLGWAGRVDAARARRFERRACELGQPTGCLVLAKQAMRPAEKMRWLEKACHIGDGDACWRLGAMFELGHGVAKDAARALSLYRDSCWMGSQDGCLMLFQTGANLPLPPRLRLGELRSLCFRGSARACEMLRARRKRR